MRRLVAAGLCMMLPVGALHAPLVHAHLDDDDHDHHHGVRAVHAHLDGHAVGHHDAAHPGRGASMVVTGTELERTTTLPMFVAAEAAMLIPPALPPARFVLPPAPESIMRRQPDVVRSHGPPVSDAAPARAPPSSPSDLTA